MDRSIIRALVDSDGLSADQLWGVITVASKLEPAVLPVLAARTDLDFELRAHLLQASQYGIVDLLDMWPPDPELVVTAAEAHGPTSALVVYCGVHGWDDLAASLAGQLDWHDVTYIGQRWAERTGTETPATVRVALAHAALTNREPRPDLESMSEWERQEALERLEEEHAARDRAAWSVIEPEPQLWESLVHDEQHGGRFQQILLEHADELTDEVLLACRPQVLSEGLRGHEYVQGLRLQRAAEFALRWPRLRVIAQPDLDLLVREVTDAGWTPSRKYGGPDWPAIAGLAQIHDDQKLLTSCVDAIRSAKPPTNDYRDREREQRWSEERASTLATLAANPRVPRDALIGLVTVLDERSLDAVREHSDGELRAACGKQLDRLRLAAEARQPKMIAVPDDDELSGHHDPGSVLQTHLKNLKHRAAQRDVTIDGLLRSRFTTAEILRALPAFRVLDCPEQAAQVARIIIDACDGDHDRWSALPAHCDPLPDRKITFGAWLDRLASTAT